MHAMLALVWLALAGIIRPDPAAAAVAKVPFADDEWSALLGKYVDGAGRVDYAAVNRDGRAAFERVFAAVAASSPKKDPALYPRKAVRAAYYINAYNVLVWKNVLVRLPGLRDIDAVSRSFFGDTRFVVGGEELSLNQLEARARSELADPRIHFALNCGSRGCPRLPREPFLARYLDAQLDAEARRFCNERRNVDFDAATRTLRLSHIFDWYKDDFGGAPAKVIAWINRYRADKLPLDAKIAYVDYDWSLNGR